MCKSEQTFIFCESEDFYACHAPKKTWSILFQDFKWEGKIVTQGHQDACHDGRFFPRYFGTIFLSCQAPPSFFLGMQLKCRIRIAPVQNCWLRKKKNRRKVKSKILRKGNYEGERASAWDRWKDRQGERERKGVRETYRGGEGECMCMLYRRMVLCERESGKGREIV